MCSYYIPQCRALKQCTYYIPQCRALKHCTYYIPQCRALKHCTYSCKIFMFWTIFNFKVFCINSTCTCIYPQNTSTPPSHLIDELCPLPRGMVEISRHRHPVTLDVNLSRFYTFSWMFYCIILRELTVLQPDKQFLASIHI